MAAWLSGARSASPFLVFGSESVRCFQSMSLHLAFSSSPRRRPVKSKSQTACRTYSSASWSIAFDNWGNSSGVMKRRRLVSGKRSTPEAGLALSTGTGLG